MLLKVGRFIALKNITNHHWSTINAENGCVSYCYIITFSMNHKWFNLSKDKGPSWAIIPHLIRTPDPCRRRLREKDSNGQAQPMPGQLAQQHWAWPMAFDLYVLWWSVVSEKGRKHSQMILSLSRSWELTRSVSTNLTIYDYDTSPILGPC